MFKHIAVFLKMPLFLIFLFSVLSSVSLYAAKDYDPSILFLVPDKAKADKTLQNEIDSMNIELKGYFNSGVEQEIPEGLQDNFMQMVKNQIEFVKDIDVYSYISFLYQQKIMEDLTMNYDSSGLLFLVEHKKKSKTRNLSELAIEKGVQFVVSFPKAEFTENKGKKSLELEIKVYDREHDIIVLEKSYLLNSENHGFDYACNEGSLYCCINNAVKASLEDFISMLRKNSMQ